jgi:formamidopyrimidine-DNA glycosylase
MRHHNPNVAGRRPLLPDFNERVVGCQTMPELPEVETMCRGICGCVGARILDVSRPRCRLKPIRIVPRMSSFRRRTVGQSIVDVQRRGKRVVICLDGGDRLVFEPRMTGLVLLADPPDRAHLRLRLQLTGTAIDELCYWDRRGLGSVRLLTPVEFDETFSPRKLGPDALAVSVAQLREQLRLSRREVKVALLDQRLLAGIGNLYASEILHTAGIHPQCRCDKMSAAQWQRLYAAMRRVLLAAIRYEGSTLADGTYRNALNRSGSYQNHHRVYSRAGQPCPTCRRGEIVRFVQAQRSTFFCPRCQRAPRNR